MLTSTLNPVYAKGDSTHVFALSEDGTRTLVFLLEPNGGVSQFTDGYPYPERFTLGGAAPSAVARVVAYSSNPGKGFTAMTREYPSRWASLYYAKFGDFWNFPSNHVFDVASFRKSDDEELAIAIDRRGLWMMYRAINSNHCFVPLILPPLSKAVCVTFGPVTQRPTQLRPLGADELGVASVALDGGADYLSLVDISEVWKLSPSPICTFVPNPCDPTDRIPASVSFGPCRTCPTGRMIDFSVLEGGTRPLFEYTCASDTTGATEHYVLTAGTGQVATCTRTRLDGEPALFGAPLPRVPEQVAPGVVAYGDGLRNVWAGESAVTALSLALSRPPAVVARSSAGAGDILAITSTVAATPHPGLGLFERRSAGALTGVVRQPSWVLLKDRQVVDVTGVSRVEDGVPVAVVGSALAALDAPYQALFVRAGNGKNALVVSASFALLAGEIGTGLAQIPARFTAPTQLRSIAFPRVPRGLDYLNGYAVAGSGVLKLRATQVHLWSDAAVASPPSLVAQEVWYDGERARVGFTDGTVYSLPSVVPIAPPLPEREVVDYVQVCGHQLALGTTGLYRLEPIPGRTVGFWASLPLPPEFVGKSFAGGRAHAAGDELYVFTRGGDTARWPFTTCSEP